MPNGRSWTLAIAGSWLALAACSDAGEQQSAPALVPGFSAEAPGGLSPAAMSPAASPASAPSPDSVTPAPGAATPPSAAPVTPSSEGNPPVSGVEPPVEPPESSPGGSMDPAPPASLEPALRFIGRVDTSDPAGARFAWSGTGVVANFRGSSVAVRLSGGQQYTVLLDGVLQPKRTSTGGLDSLATNLADGPHTLELYRRTEADQGEAQLLGIDFGAGELLAPPPPAARRIELVGDSISAGYGNEGPNMDCAFSPDTENHYLTYGALAARELGAELSTLAWSGKGVVCNYGDDASSCTNPMPTYYGRTLPLRADSQWDFSSWQPHAVVVNLGTNDFSTTTDPTELEFESAFGALLERIRGVYPGALILATVGPLLGGTDLTAARSYIANVVAARNRAGDANVKSFELAPTNPADGYGCAWHPSLRTHEVMAGALVQALRSALGW